MIDNSVSTPDTGRLMERAAPKSTIERQVKMKYIHMLCAITIALIASNVRADSPHFIRATPTFDADTGSFCVSFKEAGLGNDPITYRINVGTAIFTFQCFTRHGNEPQGDPNYISFSNDFVEATITPHNGQITATLCLDPQQGDAGCQGGGLILKLIHVELDDITFCDVTDNICLNEGSISADTNISFGGGHGH